MNQAVLDYMIAIYEHVLPAPVRKQVEYWKWPYTNPANIYRPFTERTHAIYIHIPKVAGVSISDALDAGDPWHHRAVDYELQDPDRFCRYFKFTFIRNPYDRLLSTYMYLQGRPKVTAFQRFKFIRRYPEFELFVKDWVTPENVRGNYFFRPQVDYLCDRNGNMAMDFVGRFENLAEDYLQIAGKLGINTPLPRNNTSHLRDQSRHYSNYYDEECVELVSRAYAEDLQEFGYSFDRLNGAT